MIFFDHGKTYYPALDESITPLRRFKGGQSLFGDLG
ncbi:MAG: hypothetical protein ACJA0C_000081 [Candidatus Endobugula sp.]|jgi:hypothetical protein